ncbi:glycosyl transferase [Candidatus Saganbacteria bacterium]|nr:glycosyl transferase [Candidatus Saganbacteria bacterium]
MRFGHYDGEKREYVITRPDTPLPWINYLGESKYCALISQTAGGYSFLSDPRDQRITRYRYDNIPFDQGGRYLYIRDDETGEFFSPSWAPTYGSQNSKGKIQKYECRHGMGYTTISSEHMGISAKITYFVPLGEDLEVWRVEIQNLKVKSQNISLFSFVEFCLWNAVEDQTNFQRTWSTGLAHCEGSTIFHTTQYGYWKDIFAYFSVSEKIHSYDCQRRDFLGDFGYGTLQRPKAVVEGKCSNSKAIGWAPIGAHCLKLKLKPGEKKTIIFVLGCATKVQNSKVKIQKFTKPKVVDQELKKLKEYWEENLSKLQIETPDPEMNAQINVWNQYQCMQTFNWSRYASYYEAGIGRGMGFRDSNQDTLGFVHILPQQVRKRILDLAAVQFPDGDTYHQYSPLTGLGALYGYSDDPLWLVFSTVNYIRETGDWSILKEKVPFAEKKLMVPVQQGHHEFGYRTRNTEHRTRSIGTLYEHLKRAVNFVANNLGPHGLPRSGFADWNDCLNMLGPKGKAESVLVAEMLVLAAREMEEIVGNWKIESRKLKIDNRKYGKIAEEMIKRVSKHGWDGAWFRRAYDDSGRPVGSKVNKEAQIFLETQPWAVIAGATDEEKAKKCMDSVYQKLFTRHGIKLLTPAFTRFYPELGEISTYPPGLKENASIFCHPNPWAMIAECVLGRGERAYDYYRAILPLAHNDQAEVRKTEPYVYCQMVAGPDHPDFGEGKNSWLTGSAAWALVAASQWILGIRPEYDGLLIDPCVPRKWKQFKVKRVFRGSTYIINIKNPYGVSKGVKLVKVDGRQIVGNLVPAMKARKEFHVEVVMG